MCAISAASFGNAQLQNGNFTPLNYFGSGFGTYSAGDSTDIPNWTVDSGSVDLVSSGYWQSPDFAMGTPGGWTVDLDGSAAGAISQQVNLGVGTYTLNFDLSANPEGPTDTKVFTLLPSGAVPDSFSYTLTGANNDSNMLYAHESAQFTVTTAGLQTIGFVSGDNAGSFYGPVIGDVSITPEPITMGLGIAGIGMFLRRRMKARA